MSQSTTASATRPDTRHNATQTPHQVNAAAAPVVVTEQEVLFGTRVAISPHKASIPRLLFEAVRGATHALHLPPPHQHYPTDTGYLERSRMAREMDRL